MGSFVRALRFQQFNFLLVRVAQLSVTRLVQAFSIPALRKSEGRGTRRFSPAHGKSKA
jgi:hypothetical protein